MHGQQNIKKS